MTTEDPVEEDKTAASPGPALGRRLLLVDDDVHILKSMRIYLEMEHFHVRTASGGREAIEMIESDPPDLIVLDVMMPEIDGFAVLDHVKKRDDLSAIPVIMLTAKGQDQDVLRGYKQGAHSYMTKPVNYDELVDNIQLIFDNEEMEARKGKTYEL